MNFTRLSDLLALAHALARHPDAVRLAMRRKAGGVALLNVSAVACEVTFDKTPEPLVGEVLPVNCRFFAR